MPCLGKKICNISRTTRCIFMPKLTRRRLTQVLLNDDNIKVSTSFSRPDIEENGDFLSDWFWVGKLPCCMPMKGYVVASLGESWGLAKWRWQGNFYFILRLPFACTNTPSAGKNKKSDAALWSTLAQSPFDFPRLVAAFREQDGKTMVTLDISRFKTFFCRKLCSVFGMWVWLVWHVLTRLPHNFYHTRLAEL